MKTRYFKSALTGIVWRFSDAGNEVFAGVAGWIPTAMTLDGMRVSTVEINEEDAP
jgi:hypothetical protein